MIRLKNGVELETLSGSNGLFRGLGRVTVAGVPLRSRRRPMFVEIRNPYGIWLRDYRIRRQKTTADGVVMEFAAWREQRGIMDWMVHAVRNRYAAVDWTEPPRPAADTRLTLEIRPVTRDIGERSYAGFSYQYRYRSRSIPIYRILDRGTWEPGGRAVGNEFWMRNCFTPSIVPILSRRQFHSTEWYLPSCENPGVFQFLPLQTELQGFTFTAGGNGILVTWPTQVAHVRSLFEKPRERNEIVHWHEHCGDLAHEFATSPVEVLWSAGDTSRVERANAYEAVREMVHDALHRQLGMRRERITPYGQIEEWGNADIGRYRKLGLPKLLDAGTKIVGVANHFENNMNTWGVSNMCCTVDYKAARSVGAGKLRAFCRAARRAGARVEMWGNTSVSSLTEIFSRPNGRAGRIRFLPREGSIMAEMKEAKAPFVRNPSNAIEADHYTPLFCVLNLRDPAVRAYWLRRWKDAHDDVGLEGIFLDSSFNLSSDKFHWVQNTQARLSGATADQDHLLGHYRPAEDPPSAILSEYRAHLDLVTAMQKIGYHYCSEDLGVFGIHRHGPGVAARLDCLHLWSDCIAGFDVPAIRQEGADPDEVFFRGLACRLMWALHWDIRRDRLSFHYGGVRGAFDRPRPWHLALYRAYNEVEAVMRERTILPEERGVLYRAPNGTQVLWAFSPIVLRLCGQADIRDVLKGADGAGSKIKARRHAIYLIRPRSRRRLGPGATLRAAERD